MVENKKHPHRSDGNGWTWWGFDSVFGNKASPRDSMLADNLYFSDDGPIGFSPTRQAAESALANALLRCGLIAVAGTPKQEKLEC